MSEQQVIETVYQVMKLVLDIERYQRRTETPSVKRELKRLRSNLTRTRNKLRSISLSEINAHKEQALKRLYFEDPHKYKFVDGFRFSQN